MRRRGIYVKRSHAAAAIVVACSVFSFLLGFNVQAAERDSWDRFQEGESLSVETGLSDGFSTMNFICLDTDYRGGYLFIAEDVIPYSLSTRYAASDNAYIRIV